MKPLHVGLLPDFELVRRVKLRLRAGLEGFETEVNQFVEIVNSITGRFGQPERASRPSSANMSAE